jgi:hypothetical protein
MEVVQELYGAPEMTGKMSMARAPTITYVPSEVQVQALHGVDLDALAEAVVLVGLSCQSVARCMLLDRPVPLYQGAP